MPRESEYQRGLVNRIEKRFPDCEVLRGDPVRRQGQLDLIILFAQGVWAKLEVKRAANARRQPNQQYYVEEARKKSFAAIIHPDNEEQVLNDIQTTLGV